MLKKRLAALAAPIVLAGIVAAGGAASRPTPTGAIGSFSDAISFHGTLRLSPNATHPTSFQVIQDSPAFSTSTCSLYSSGDGPSVPCQASSHGTVSGNTLTGTTTIQSADGVIILTGSVPIGGRATVTGKEVETNGHVTTGLTVTGSISTWTDMAGVIHVSASFCVSEPSAP